MVHSSCMCLFYERPVQFRFNRLIINKVMLVYFCVDFVTVLFCIALTQSVCFRSFNLIRSIDHLYQSNGDLILCYSRHFGVQNGSLQAEILQHVLDFELKQFTESITKITIGTRNRLSLLWLNWKRAQIITITYGLHQAINCVRGPSLSNELLR